MQQEGLRRAAVPMALAGRDVGDVAALLGLAPRAISLTWAVLVYSGFVTVLGALRSAAT